jgi:capsular polysaccharide export protein
MKVLILKPRLDVTFKEGPVPEKKGTLLPIRVHWEKFVNNLYIFHKSRGDSTRVLEKPLWQMSPQDVPKDTDLVYIPHKDKNRFFVDHSKCLYYMQMVFPWLFEVAEEGPFSLSTRFPQKIYPEINRTLLDRLLKRVSKKESKFDQPTSDNINFKNYVLFVGQMERDEAIQIHSKISVKESLIKTIIYCANQKLDLLFKPHPFDRDRKLITAARNNGIPIVNNNIFDLLQNCSCVVTVNSGVGMEAIVCNKPVFFYGEAEYSPVALNANNEFRFNDKNKYIDKYPEFLTSYFKDRIDSESIESYKYIESFL